MWIDRRRTTGSGRPAVRQRCAWVLLSGARWHDLPERYGKYKSVHTRFMRWARVGVWERIFAYLVDSTIVRAHQQAAAGRKKGVPAASLWGVPEVD